MKFKGAVVSLLVGVMVCVAGVLLVMAAVVYSQSSDTAADRALEKMNNDFATKVWVEQRAAEMNKRIENVGSWLTTAQEAQQNMERQHNADIVKAMQFMQAQTKEIELLKVRQLTMEKKQIGLKKTVDVTHRFEEPIEVDVFPESVQRSKGKGAGALLKRSGVSKQ